LTYLHCHRPPHYYQHRRCNVSAQICLTRECTMHLPSSSSRCWCHFLLSISTDGR